ncbi:MAG: glucosyl-3-phosphoglycerate synthase [Acidimicrobiia bacterium]
MATPPALLPVPLCSEDFDVVDLLRRKQERGLTISVCLPARDEEPTVGHIVATVRRTLMETVPLVDEVVVIDDGSLDSTPDVAAWEGARVIAVDDVLPEAGSGSGKGNAMWKSLHATTGDIVCWVDADIRNFGHHFITGLVGPLVTDDEIAFVKGYYRRPLHGEPSGGGRVTELVARPTLSVLFPELAGFIQPLSGEYAGRRSLLESVPFVEGWGVEIGLLVDIVRAVGLGATAQVDLGVREHRNRPLEDLGPQATAILVTALRRAGLVDPTTDRAPVTLTRFTEAFEPDVVDVEVRERPPMRTIPAYREKFGLGVGS